MNNRNTLVAVAAILIVVAASITINVAEAAGYTLTLSFPQYGDTVKNYAIPLIDGNYYTISFSPTSSIITFDNYNSSADGTSGNIGNLWISLDGNNTFIRLERLATMEVRVNREDMVIYANETDGFGYQVIVEHQPVR